VPDEIFSEYGVKKASLLDIAKNNKVVSLHAAKTEGSRHLIDREFLKNMQDGALFINTARGSVVDEEALADEAISGRIRAVLDVYEVEPLPLDSRLRNLPNVTLVPHMGGPTIDMREYVAECVIDDIERYLKGDNLKYEVERSYALRMTNEYLK
jgi:phosphoglycerate dehydrogenase-like enzyme